MGRPLIMLNCLTILRNQTNCFPKYGQKWPSMVINLVTYGWVHQMRARHTTVLLTQKLVQISQKLILLFQLLLANYKMHWPGVLSANVYQCAGNSLWKIPVNIFGSLWWFISYLPKKDETHKKKLLILRKPHSAAVATKWLQEVYETAIWSLLSLNNDEQCWRCMFKCTLQKDMYNQSTTEILSSNHKTLFISDR